MELADIRYDPIGATVALDDPEFQAFRDAAWANPTWLGIVNDQFRDAVRAAQARSQARSSSVVYFIQQGSSGPIKIGCSRNLTSRLNSLRTSSSEPLHVLGTVPGGFELERQMHQALDAFRLNGEWFTPSLKVLRLIRKQLELSPST
ncbi:GIY-YIG nuclease family protein [Curtobacterium sp. Arg-1]|uniref:GIY-YIG nuclease family protein n=1 Tax=Curtobacterium sp. Arg-1 TaxID=2935040 RepID=UPI0021D80E7C|nr:GIY-YIG nuclease family protein [Curtobacterium sp. Arg-1]UXZ57051.1 GIY-YIG nuclease family protein [Curtobacterium sp. Arg-1]